MEFFSDIEVNAEQARAIARGLYAVASMDGIHQREAALIARFYGVASENEPRPVTSLAALARLGPISQADLAEALPGEKLRQLFVKAALMLAYLDGKVTGGERLKIAGYARTLGVSAERQAALEESVRALLREPLVRPHETGAVPQVAENLGR